MPSMDELIRLRRDAVRARPDLLDPPTTVEPAGPSAAAALPDPGPLATFRVLVLEVPPYDYAGITRGEFADLPADFALSLDALIAAHDAALCWRCGTGVGMHVDGEADEIQRWQYTALVSGPGEDAVSWQCEECAPDTAAAPWEPGRPPSVWAVDMTSCVTEAGGARTAHVRAVGAVTCRCGQMEPRRGPEVAGS